MRVCVCWYCVNKYIDCTIYVDCMVCVEIFPCWLIRFHLIIYAQWSCFTILSSSFEVHTPNIIYLLFSLFSFVNLIKDFSVFRIFSTMFAIVISIYLPFFGNIFRNIFHCTFVLSKFLYLINGESKLLKWDTINIFSDNF